MKKTAEEIAGELFGLTIQCVDVYFELYPKKPLDKMAIGFLHTGYSTALLINCDVPKEVSEEAIRLCQKQLSERYPEIFGNSIPSPMRLEKVKVDEEDGQRVSGCCGAPIVNENCTECKENI